jgi:5-methylthioribose kinase
VIDIEQREALRAYLLQRDEVPPDSDMLIQPLAGGVSNRTILVTFANGEAWVLKQALEKLRVPVDWFSDPARIHREGLGLRHLRALIPADHLPQFVFEDFENHILAMSAIPQPHENWKTMLLRGSVSPDYVRQFATLLAAIHNGAFERRDDLRDPFADRSFFQALRLEPYYLYTADQVPGAAGFLRDLVRDTGAHQITLVHGDFSPKNILVYHDTLVLLDYEVIHWGDPAFDVGFAMTHLLSKAHHVAAQRAEFVQAAGEFWTTYFDLITAAPLRDGLEARACRHTLACLLARVDGRSPLEYLSASERDTQRRCVLKCMQAGPATIATLIAQFADLLEAECQP